MSPVSRVSLPPPGCPPHLPGGVKCDLPPTRRIKEGRPLPGPFKAAFQSLLVPPADSNSLPSGLFGTPGWKEARTFRPAFQTLQSGCPAPGSPFRGEPPGRIPFSSSGPIPTLLSGPTPGPPSVRPAGIVKAPGGPGPKPRSEGEPTSGLPTERGFKPRLPLTQSTAQPPSPGPPDPGTGSLPREWTGPNGILLGKPGVSGGKISQSFWGIPNLPNSGFLS